MREFIFGIIGVFPGFLQRPARWVAERILAVWDDLSNVLRVVVQRWWPVFHGLLHFLNWVSNSVIEVYRTLWWFLRVRLPQHFGWWFDRTLQWVRDHVWQMVLWLRSMLGTVRDWLWARIVDVARSVTNLARWAFDRVSQVWDTLRVVASRVFALLTHPEVLVSWVLGAMVAALTRWFLSNVDRLADALWAARTRMLLRTAARIEAFVERIL